uniref:Uncharacterized protein n=1 Tax=Oryza punctata TaxID=4537 RepID=A0A0E0KH65_ORYPU
MSRFRASIIYKLEKRIGLFGEAKILNSNGSVYNRAPTNEAGHQSLTAVAAEAGPLYMTKHNNFAGTLGQRSGSIFSGSERKKKTFHRSGLDSTPPPPPPAVARRPPPPTRLLAVAAVSANPPKTLSPS